MMSSAISTKGPSADTRTRQAAAPPAGEADAGFQPWHFFVLASLAAATVAVVLSRQAAPEHLILISLMIGAAGYAGAALYRMLAPLAARDAAVSGPPASERARTALEREKALVLRSIKELEFDRAMGKISPGDFEEMAGRLRARAMMLIRQVDEGATGYREIIEKELSARLAGLARAGDRSAAVAGPAEEPAPSTLAAPARQSAPAPSRGTGLSCSACGTANDADAAFCKRCGAALEAGA